MSSSDAESSLANSWPAGLTLTGGIPTESQDLAASIVFAVAFLLLLPLAILRFAQPATRTWVLLRPTIVATLRIATYIIRAVEAKGNYSEGLFIAEQVLLLSGLIPLVDPIVSLLRAHVKRNWIPEPPARAGEEQKKRTMLDRALRVLKLAVLVAIILGIVSGVKAGNAINDPDQASQLKTYRYATIGLTLFIIGVSALVCCAVHVRDGLPLRGTLFILLACGILLIPNLYKLVTALHHPSMLSGGTKAAFYLLSAWPEHLCILLYLWPNLNEMFDLPEAKWKEKVEGKMKKGEWPAGMGYVGKAEYEQISTRGSFEMTDAAAYNKA
ncbi:hypothetical protein JCM8547_002587 [Rhodosporidiobolus lusitaniae]